MAVVKTGNPTIDDLFEIEKLPIPSWLPKKDYKLVITPSKLNGVYEIARQDAIYIGLLRRKEKGPLHSFLLKTEVPGSYAIWTYTASDERITAQEKSGRDTQIFEDIADVTINAKRAKCLYDGKSTTKMTKEALLAKMLLDKYLPKESPATAEQTSTPEPLPIETYDYCI